MMPETVEFDLDSHLYGAGLAANIVAGAWIRSWYINWIKNQSLLFPDDDENNNQDEEWALATEEISNWSMLCTFTVGVYGANWLLWALNLSVGNDGSIVHKLFFVSLLLQRYVPLMSLFLIFKLNASYLPSDASYTYWATLDAATPNKMLYLFNPGEGVFAKPSYDDPTWINRRWILFFASVFSFGTTNYSFNKISMKYFMASAMAALNKPEEEPVEEEEVAEEAVEEAVAEEEFF
jgi:hypothetical protein